MMLSELLNDDTLAKASCRSLGREDETSAAGGTAAAGSSVLLAAPAAGAEPIMGISYGPAPLKSIEGASQLPADDWFSSEAVMMWGRAGRGDLHVIRQLGANMVRLYGNYPDLDHTNFLDEAHKEGLGVAAGMSDWPYYQMVPGSCITTNYNCFDQVRELYLKNLQKGFVRADGSYHPALRYFNILNEPDLKVPSTTDIGGPEEPRKMAKALVSSFDALLDAEKEIGVSGPLINFTATFSYAICANCVSFGGKPALGQMAELDDAMRNPEEYGYTPINDITAAYLGRFTHSFNTQNPATDLQGQFLADYTEAFPSTPVYIGEYHRVGADQVDDLSTILAVAQQNPLFLGISFFQYQVAYMKTGTEMDFGMWGLGDTVLAEMSYLGTTYNIYCLTPQDSPGQDMPSSVATVYGGDGVDASTLCLPGPDGVPLNETGFATITAQGAPQMARFAERYLEHLGGTVSEGSRADLDALAEGYVGEDSGSFEELASALGARPDWVSFDEEARCVANRYVEPHIIGDAIQWICEQGDATVNCDDIPYQCESTYLKADYLFSRWYQEHSAGGNPVVDCYFQGAGIFASSEIYGRWTGASQCVEGGVTITTTYTSPRPRPSTSPEEPTTPEPEEASTTPEGPEETTSKPEDSRPGGNVGKLPGGNTGKQTSTVTTTSTATVSAKFLSAAPRMVSLPAAAVMPLLALLHAAFPAIRA